MSKPSVGFIGLGLMGSAMVSRLLDLGYPVTVMANRSRTQVDIAVGRGAKEAKTARELAAASDFVLLCMDTSASVEGRMFGEDGVIAGLKAGAIAIDFGTSLPASTKKIGAAVSEAGGSYLDAPLGRTPAHAVDGLLNIMCAGDKVAYDKAEPVLKDLGENVFHLGALGNGHTIKLINNFFGMTLANAMSEAFAMADLAGVDRTQLHSVMAAGPLHSMMMDFVKAYAVDGKADSLAFTVRNARKDVGYYAAMAESLGTETIMGNAAKQALGLSVTSGRGETMVSEQVDFFAELLSPKDNK
ncbi:MAG: NAD(P)-dependent oxidoreductase [Roseibium sp.]